MVFRRYRPPPSVKIEGSSSRELGSPPEFVVPASARRCPGAFLGVSNLFATSTPRVHIRRTSQARLCSALSVSHALDGFLLAVPCRLVSSCCHVQASRFRGFLPRPDRDHLLGGPCLRAVGAVSCRRLPDDAGERRVDLKACSRPGSAAPSEGLAPPLPVSPRALLLLRARFVSLRDAVNVSSARGLGQPVLAVPRSTNPQRIDRLTTSMLYP
jgi:hypothetical protein